MRRAAGLAAVLLLMVAGSSADGQAVGGGDPMVHLEAIVGRSTPPEYRRFGSPGMADAASYAAGVLDAAGYAVLRADYPASVYRPDYRPGHAPLLERVDDGVSFPTESAFQLGATGTVTCVVKPVASVGPGDCGFVPFRLVSPEWKNVLADVSGQVDAVLAQGGAGVVLQGDIRSGSLIALRVRKAIPTVVAVVDEADVVGRTVRLRAEGATAPATLHDVVAVRPPADPAAGYVLLQGHLDGWFEAAADNGGGAAAVLAAAERLAGLGAGRRGLLVALYDGEEWGLQGSKAFAEDLADGLTVGSSCVHLDDIAAVVNLDAPSAIASDVPVSLPLFSWRVLVSSEDLNLAAAFYGAMTGAGVLGLPVTATMAEPINGGLERTDALWFDDAGIPVAWPVAGYPEYHTTADTLATVDPADLRAVTAGAVALVRSLDGVSIGRLPGSTLSTPGSRVCEAATPPTSTTTTVARATAAPVGSLPTSGRSSAGAAVAALLAALAVATRLVVRRV